jgi:hypothetical protein
MVIKILVQVHVPEAHLNDRLNDTMRDTAILLIEAAVLEVMQHVKGVEVTVSEAEPLFDLQA